MVPAFGGFQTGGGAGEVTGRALIQLEMASQLKGSDLISSETKRPSRDGTEDG